MREQATAIATAPKYDPDELSLKQPEMRWEDDPLLALHEAHFIRATHAKGIRSKQEVSEVDPVWENTVIKQLNYLQYLEDYYTKLSPKDRERLERVMQAPEE